MSIGKYPLGVGVALVDGLHLLVKAVLPCPRRRPLSSCSLLEHGGPQQEASTLIGEILVFQVQDMLPLGQGLVSHTHGLIQRNVV
jgi:hypothetical protein